MKTLEWLDSVMRGAAKHYEQGPFSHDCFAVTEIANPTRCVISYAIRWGEHAAWTCHRLAPGMSRAHSWAYRYPNENRSPIPFIRFDCNLASCAVVNQEYQLKGCSSPHSGFGHGMKYRFMTRDYGNRLDLVGGS